MPKEKPMTVKLRDEILNLVDEFTKKSIELELKVQEMTGKKTFKEVWIGEGWLSKDKVGTITFIPAKYK
tara:strand:- start:54 stop:260 length:207 start_codon:yes stop_codon:yes gene_type:complete